MNDTGLRRVDAFEADIRPAPEPGRVENDLRIWHARPRRGTWEYDRHDETIGRLHLYKNGAGVLVTSSLSIIRQADGRLSPEWCVSISHRGDRPGPRVTRRILEIYNFTEAEEDNHEPGVARKWWLPVREDLRRAECECKDELTIVEPDGYEWQPALEKRDVPVVGFCRTRGDSPATTGIHEQFVNPVPPHARR